MCSTYKPFLHVGKKKLLITCKNHEKIPWAEPCCSEKITKVEYENWFVRQ